VSVPLWKVKRELVRLVLQIGGLPRRLIWYYGATPFYDRILSKQRQSWVGEQEASSKMAVMVIYPTDGLLDSHALTLRHLAENGYASVVVSNLPLSSDDRDRVLTHCAHYIERPNFGYDFGAYRDGVLSISDKLPDLDRLVLTNDSAWYPLPNTSNWLREAEKLNVDLAGAVSNYGTPRSNHASFRTLRWAYSTDHPNFHYCSFALSFGLNILKSNAFRRFWSDFQMDNDKSRVVRRGEIGLTRWVIRNGFTHDCTCKPETLPDVLENLTDDRLRQVVQRTIFPEYPLGQAAKKSVLDVPFDDPEWRPLATRYVLMAATVQGTSYALPELTTKEMRFPFLKKSPLRLSRAGSDISLDIIAEIPGRTGKIVLQEANLLRQSRTTKYDALEKSGHHDQ